MTKKEKDRQRVLNGGRGGGQTYRRLFEYYENKVYALNEKIGDLEKENKELKSDIETMIPLLTKAKGMSEGLSKAKEIIKELLFTSNELDENTRSKAEQFLKEE